MARGRHAESRTTADRTDRASGSGIPSGCWTGGDGGGGPRVGHNKGGGSEGQGRARNGCGQNEGFGIGIVAIRNGNRVNDRTAGRCCASTAGRNHDDPGARHGRYTTCAQGGCGATKAGGSDSFDRRTSIHEVFPAAVVVCAVANSEGQRVLAMKALQHSVRNDHRCWPSFRKVAATVMV